MCRSVMNSVISRLSWKYSLVPFKTKVLYLLAFLTFVLILFVNVQYLLSPKFVPFEDISATLLPRMSLLKGLPNNVCAHVYEKQISYDQISLVTNVSDSDLAGAFSESSGIRKGGSWTPKHCVSKYRVNLVVPYRNRPQHLNDYLHYMHHYLPLQQIDYRIFVVEQSPEKPFNRGKLFNVGFAEGEKIDPADCYIFHDVDLIPLSLNNLYACTRMPRHMSTAVDVFNFQLPYSTIFGGVVAFSRQHFLQTNGYSNSFFGWGGEDDDLYYRVRQARLDPVRFEPAIARYKMLSHNRETPNPDRFSVMKKGRRKYSVDGLADLNYTLVTHQVKPLYTWILVHL